MKILFVGHDVTYAGFFAAIEVALAKRTAVQAKHVYFRPSAALWARWGLRQNVSCPAAMRLLGRWRWFGHRSGSLEAADSVDLRFYLNPAAPSDSAAHRRLRSLLVAYMNWLTAEFGAEHFDLAILPGEFRLFEQAVRSVIERMPRPPSVLFFEAGPPGYVYFDPHGVNAAASFSQTGRSTLLALARDMDPSPPSAPDHPLGPTLPPARVRQFAIAIDMIWLALCKATGGLLDLEEYWVAAMNRLGNQTDAATVPPESSHMPGMRRVVFIGQVRRDVNHTHFGLSDDALEDRLTALLHEDPSTMLAWRDHPLERSERLLQRLSDRFPGRVARDPERHLSNLIARCDGAVTVNSNGGLEALSAGIPVLLLGQSYYASVKGVCRDTMSFLSLRQQVCEGGPLQHIQDDADRFLRECFIPIDYRGADFSRADLAARFLLACKS